MEKMNTGDGHAKLRSGFSVNSMNQLQGWNRLSECGIELPNVSKGFHQGILKDGRVFIPVRTMGHSGSLIKLGATSLREHSDAPTTFIELLSGHHDESKSGLQSICATQWVMDINRGPDAESS
jgi:hypothetical protein